MASRLAGPDNILRKQSVAYANVDIGNRLSAKLGKRTVLLAFDGNVNPSIIKLGNKAELMSINSPDVADMTGKDVLLALSPGVPSHWTKAGGLKTEAPVVALNAPFSLNYDIAQGTFFFWGGGGGGFGVYLLQAQRKTLLSFAWGGEGGEEKEMDAYGGSHEGKTLLSLLTTTHPPHYHNTTTQAGNGRPSTSASASPRGGYTRPTPGRSRCILICRTAPCNCSRSMRTAWCPS